MCGPSCNPETNDRWLKLLDFATYNNLVLAYTLGNHKPYRRRAWHSPDGTHHNQIDYILVKKRFRSDIKTARTRTFPGADVGNDHDMVMMTSQTRLKTLRTPAQPIIGFDFEKLNDPTVMSAFQATLGGIFAPLASLVDEDDSMITHFNKAVTDTAAELLGKQRRKRTPWVTTEILYLCGQGRDLKKKRGEPEGAKDYREIKRKIRTEMKMAKETWIQSQCQEVEACFRKNNSKKTYQLIKILTTEKQGLQAMIDTLTSICNKVWKTEEWLTTWTQFLVIILPKKGNLQLCQNFRTISLISHPSKVMLKIILNRLQPQAEEIIAEEQAGFRAGRTTTEQIFNIKKYLQHQQNLYHVFIDFKNAFDRVWHEALWATIRKYVNASIIRAIENLYDKAQSTVLFSGSTGEWFRTTVGVRQGCLLSTNPL